MAEETDWGNKGVSDDFETRSQKYAGRQDFTDLIRIVSKPKKFYTHNQNKPPYGINCNKANGRCPACEIEVDGKKLKRVQKIGCLVVHIGQKHTEAEKFKKVGKVKPWVFGADKWNRLCALIDNYAVIRKEGLQKHDLMVSLKEQTKDAEQYQKLNIDATFEDSKARTDMLENKDDAGESLDWLTRSRTPEEQEKMFKKAKGESYDDDSGEPLDDKPKNGDELLDEEKDVAFNDDPIDEGESNEDVKDGVTVDDVNEILG